MLALATIPGRAGARELSIDAGPCAEKVRIHAHDVPMQEIVSGLANAMGVRLVAKTSLSDRVSFDASGPAEDVLKRLLHDKNLVVETGRKAACGTREVLATVWLLPAGEEAPARAAARASEPNMQQPGQVEFRSYGYQQPPRAKRRGGRPRGQEEEQPKPEEPAATPPAH